MPEHLLDDLDRDARFDSRVPIVCRSLWMLMSFGTGETQRANPHAGHFVTVLEVRRTLSRQRRHTGHRPARVDPAELAIEIGPLTVPPPLATAADEQVAASPRRRQTGFVQRDT